MEETVTQQETVIADLEQERDTLATKMAEIELKEADFMSLFIPELATQMLISEVSKRLVISNLATDISKTIPEIAWQGKTINFPVFKRGAVASDITDNGSVTPSELDGENIQSMIKHVASSVKFHKDQLKYAGNQLADMALQDLAGAMALKLDADIMATAIAGATLKNANF